MLQSLLQLLALTWGNAAQVRRFNAGKKADGHFVGEQLALQVWRQHVPFTQSIIHQPAKALGHCRQLIGATNPLTAAPGSIRADFAQSIGRNLVHGSDSKGAADRELKIFFNANEFVSRKHDMDRWISEQK